MDITQLIEILEDIRDQHGEDIPIKVLDTHQGKNIEPRYIGVSGGSADKFVEIW